MKSLAFVLAVAIIQCVTSYPAPEKVGVIREGPGSLVTIEGPDGSVIKTQIGLGSVPILVPSVPVLIPWRPVLVPSVPVLPVPAPKDPTEVELVEPKTETEETEQNDGDESVTEPDEETETVEEVTNGEQQPSGDVARVLQAEENLKQLQQNEIEAQRAANEQAIAQIQEQNQKAW